MESKTNINFFSEIKNITGLISSCHEQEFIAFEALRNLSLVKPLWNKLTKVIITLPEKNLLNHRKENFLFDGIETFLIRKKDEGCIEAYRSALEHIETEIIYFTMDDRHIKSFDTKNLDKAINIFQANNFDSLRLNNDGPMPVSKRLISKIPNNNNYKVSLTNILIKKSFFCELLKDHKDIWELDKFGGKYKKCYAPSLINYLNPLMDVNHLIFRGKILSKSESYLFNKKLLNRIPNKVGLFLRVYNFLYRKLLPIYCIFENILKEFIINFSNKIRN